MVKKRSYATAAGNKRMMMNFTTIMIMEMNFIGVVVVQRLLVLGKV
jgi:hypothetical protein